MCYRVKAGLTNLIVIPSASHAPLLFMHSTVARSSPIVTGLARNWAADTRGSRTGSSRKSARHATVKTDSQSSRSAGNECGYVFKYMVKFPQLIFLHGTCSCCDLRAMYLNRNRIYLVAAARRLWISLNPRPAGPLDFPPPAGGGGSWRGRLNAPLWSRLLVAVEKNERQRSKAREKSFRNHLGHFLAQVKIGVSRGQNSKIFQNGFSTIKSLILKIEQRIWYHRVRLVKARRTIYKMTLKGQVQSSTSGQVRSRSRDDRNGSYCISIDSPGHDKRTDTNPTSLSLFEKLLANDGWWPRVTSNDLWMGR